MPVVLCIDNEQSILQDVSCELSTIVADQYFIEWVGCQEDPLAVTTGILQEQGDIALVIAPYTLPNRKGDDLLQQIQTLSPFTVTILLAQTEDFDTIQAENLFLSLSHPLHPKTLKASIQAGLQHYELQQRLRRTQQQLEEKNLFSPQNLDAILAGVILGNDDSSPHYINTTAQEICGLKEEDLDTFCQEHLQENENKYRSAFETAATAFCILSPQGEFLCVNAAACQLWGYSERELLELSFGDITHPEDIEISYSYVEQLFERKVERYRLEKRYLHKNGQIIWGLVSVSLVRDRANNPLYVITQVQDITATKETEFALRQREAQLNTIFTKTSDGILILDQQGFVRLANPAAAHLFSTPLEELLDYQWCMPLDQATEITIVQTNKDRKIAELQSTPTEWFGEPVHIIALHDITDRKHAQSILEAKAKQQAAIAQLGLEALKITDLSALMERAIALVSQTLNIKYCKIFELLPDGEELLLTAGRGWRVGYVGQMKIPSQGDSQAGYTLACDRAVIVKDFRTETRFRVPQFLLEHGMISSITVVIHGQDQPFGVLGVDTPFQQDFSEDDVNFLQAIANVLATAIQRQRTETALREAEAKFQRLVENVPGVIFRYWFYPDGSDKMSYISSACQEIYEIKPEVALENVGVLWALILPQDLDILQSSLQASAKTLEPLQVEYRIRPPSGGTKWLQVFARPTRKDDGSVFWDGVKLDISDRKQAELALEYQLHRSHLLHKITDEIRSQLNIQQLFQTAAVQIGQAFGVSRALIHTYIPTPTPKIVLLGEYVAPNYAVMPDNWQISVVGNPYLEKILAQDTAVVVHNVYTEPLLKHFGSLYEQIGLKSLLAIRTSYKGFANGVIGLHCCDYHRNWTEEDIEFLQAIAAQLGIAIAQAQLLKQEQLARVKLEQEIRDRISTEEALRQSQERFTLAVEGAKDGIWDWNLQTNEAYLSPRWKQMLGYQDDELPDRMDSWKQYLHYEDRDRVMSVLLGYLAGYLPTYEVEFRARHKDGSYRWILARGTALHDANGQPYRMAGSHTDITVQKQREEALRLIMEGTASSTGSDFFHSCVYYLAEVLHVRYALVTEWANESQTRLQTLAFWQEDDFGDNIEYEVMGTPSEYLFQKQVCIYIEDVQKQFPDDSYLTKLNVSSYLAIPLFDSTHNIIGCLSVFDEQPMSDVAGKELILKIFAARAGAELERKQAGEALQQSHTRYQNLAANVPGMIYQFRRDAQGDYSFPYVSAACKDIFGVSPKTAQENAQAIFDVIHPEDLEHIHIAIDHSTQTQTPWHWIGRIVVNHEIKWIQGDSRLSREEAGALIWEGVVIDITERKRAEEVLEESAKREQLTTQVIQKMRSSLEIETIFRTTTEELRQVLNCDRTAIYRFNPDWSGEFVFEAISEGQWEMMSNTNRHRLLNQQAVKDESCSIHSLLSQGRDTYLQDTQGGKFRQGVTYVCVDDVSKAELSPCYRELLELLQVRAYLIVPIFEGDRLWGLLASYQNIAPRHWHEAEINVMVQIGNQLGVALQQAELLAQTQDQATQLEQAAIAADAANRAKSLFLANMSHELRTPLNAILGFAQLLHHSGKLPLQQQEQLNIIAHSGEHLLSLINDILDFSKIEAGRITFNETDFALIPFLDELQQIFQLKAHRKGLELIFDYDVSLPSHLRTDAVKLRQVLINLLSNAIKFTQVGSVTLEVSLQHQNDHSVKIHFAVRDTGVGIAEAELSQLFDPFVQTQAGISAQEGTGLGLAISDRYVQLLGGKIAVSSQLGGGTTFEFTISAHVPETSLTSTAFPAFPVALTPESRHFRLLIADDKDSNRQLLLQTLSPLGFEIQAARNGSEAFQKWQTFQPHLIFMDLQMPEMNGYEATRKIRQQEQESDAVTPTIIIALTASVFDEHKAIASEAGCDDFIIKPVSEVIIFDKISDYLGVSYVYEDNSTSLKPTEDLDSVTNLTALQQIDDVQLADLEAAILTSDLEAIESAIALIQQTHAPLAQLLYEYVQNFEYFPILEAIQIKSY